MKPRGRASGVSRVEAAGARVERRVISALLTLVGLAVAWWVSAWWRVAAAEDVHARAAVREAVALQPLSPPIEHRPPLVPNRQARRAPTRVSDAGSATPAPFGPRVARPAPASGLDQGHGGELWSRSDRRDRYEFEPRLSLDGGVLEEPSVAEASGPGAFH
jgi:hypothetical protein